MRNLYIIAEVPTRERPIRQTLGQQEAHHSSRTIIFTYLHSAKLPQTLPIRRRARLFFARDHDQCLQFTTSAHTPHRHFHCIPQRLVESPARADDLQAREGGPGLSFERAAERGYALLDILCGELDEAQRAQVPHACKEAVPATVRHSRSDLGCVRCASQGSVQNERVQSGHSGGRVLENRQNIAHGGQAERTQRGSVSAKERRPSSGIDGSESWC